MVIMAKMMLIGQYIKAAPNLPKWAVVGIPVGALLLGASAGAVARDSAPTTVHGGPSAGTGLSAVEPPPVQSVLDQKTHAGFTVEFQEATNSAEALVVFYRAFSEEGAWADMLGIPRIENPDGSIVLPSEYGSVGSDERSSGGIPGLPAGSQGAVFQGRDVQPGAVVRFGPFFRSSAESISVTATGDDLTAGVALEIGGEAFTVTAIANEDGTTSIQFVNTTPDATVVATHPGSRVVITVGGKDVPDIHGSTNFAKTVGYDVNANRSTVDVAGSIPGYAEVTLTSSSIGRVHRGAWDFPLD